MRQKTVITKVLQIMTEVYYKMRQVLQSALGITRCDRLLLQSASVITKWDVTQDMSAIWDVRYWEVSL